MASSTPLPTLLKGLNIGVASSKDEASSSNTQHVAPKLALSDQLHLLSAHIDTLEKSVQASVSSQEGRETIKRQGERSISSQKRIAVLQRRVQSLEGGEEGKDIGGAAVLECLAQYIGAQKRLQRERRLHQLTILVRDAVLALERLQSRLQHGQLDAEGLAAAIAEANQKASLLGIRGIESDGNGSAHEEDYRWIAKSSGAPPLAIQELGSRLDRAKEGIRQLLKDSWSECVVITTDSTSMRLRIRGKAQSCDITLPNLMVTLQSRSELQLLLEKLALDIVEQIFPPLLTPNTSWIYKGQLIEDWQAERGHAGRTPNDTATALVQLLDVLQKGISQLAPPSVQASFTVSKIIVPALLPMFLRYLKASLPARVEKPIASSTMPRLEDIAKAATEVYDALLKGDYLQRDLRDEADDLLDWMKNTRKHYMKSLGTQLRTRARDILLREAGGGWQAVAVDIEIEEEMPIAVQGGLRQEAETADDFPPEEGEKAEEVRLHWDAASTPPAQAQIPRSSSITGRNKQKKTALGGRRVVKPADELGSGPIPENADEVSWGFDDDLTLGEQDDGLGNTTEAPTKMSYDALMEALDQNEDVDEDAWGLSEEEKVEIAAKRASMRASGGMAAAFQVYQASMDKEKEKSSLQQIQDTEKEEDEDDAWGLSAQEAIQDDAEKSSGSGEKLSDTTTDPWEEISAPQSNTAASVRSSTTPAAAAAAAAAPATTAAASNADGNLEVNDDPSPEPMTSIEAQSVPSPPAAARIHALHVERLPSQDQGDASPAKQNALQLDSASPQKDNSSQSMAAPAPIALTRPKEKCVISKRSVSLMEVIEAVLDDVEAILDEDMGRMLDTSYLVSALHDVLDMHRGLLPVGHADTLASVPSLAMQFANDCLYIGKELKQMRKRWDAIQSRLPSEEKLDIDMQAELTMSLGKRSFDGQLMLQHKTLLDCLQDAEGFTRTYEESRFNACQRSIKQVEMILGQLQSAWRPVLTKSSYMSAMGRLVEGLLKKLMFDIESIEDISEVESEKLASLIKTMGELEHLFRDDGQPAEESIVTLYVPSWFKASYLSEILTGSLVDIEFLYFEAGALVDYSKPELISLIRSLFADTPKRARIIDRIQAS